MKNLLIDLAIALAGRFTNVVVNDFSAPGAPSYQVEVNGTLYAYNTDMGWNKPEVGDYGPGKYELELRDRLMKGATLALAQPATPAKAPAKQGPPVPAKQGPPVPAAPIAKPSAKEISKLVAAHKAYRLKHPNATIDPKGAPAYEGEPCRRCKGSGVYPHPVKGDSTCWWCHAVTTTQYYGWWLRTEA